jgi:hypothetical protein
MGFTLRRATAFDADAIANVYCTSFRLLTFLPMLHTAESYRWFVSNVTLKECEVTVAEDETEIVAFLARRRQEIRLLYTRPDRIGMGALPSFVLVPIGSMARHSSSTTESSRHYDRMRRGEIALANDMDRAGDIDRRRQVVMVVGKPRRLTATHSRLFGGQMRGDEKRRGVP